MTRFIVGDAIVTKISELELDGVPPDALFPDVAPSAVVERARSFSAGSFDADTRTLRQSIHTWLVQLAGRTILIDTASGNDKHRPTMPMLDHLHEPYLDRLAAAGVQPESVDTVLMTHVHADHVGWNTRLHQGRWAPTFPNARYYLSAVEADYNAAVDAGDVATAEALRGAVGGLGPMHHLPAAGVYTDSVAPVAAAGLTQRIAVGTEVLPGLRYHHLPGHSIDHAGIMLESAGDRALFWGDVLHHPVQVEETDWNSVFCEFPQAARVSRRRALDLAADSGALVFTTHFPESSSGRVRREADGYAWTFEAGDAA